MANFANIRDMKKSPSLLAFEEYFKTGDGFGGSDHHQNTNNNNINDDDNNNNNVHADIFGDICSVAPSFNQVSNFPS